MSGYHGNGRQGMVASGRQQIAECYRRADEFRQRAAETNDAVARDELLEMKFHWLLLAQSYEFAEHVANLDHDLQPKQHRGA